MNTAHTSGMAALKKGQPLLLIDRNLETELKMKDALSQTPYNVLRYTSGEEGLNAIPAIKPCLIVCDFNTTDLNAVQIFNAFMTESRFHLFRHIPFVIFSEYADRSRYSEALFLKGLWGWFTKPFGDHELREVVENLLSVHGIIQRNRELSKEVTR